MIRRLQLRLKNILYGGLRKHEWDELYTIERKRPTPEEYAKLVVKAVGDKIKAKIFWFRCKYQWLLPAKATFGGRRYYMSKTFHYPVATPTRPPKRQP